MGELWNLIKDLFRFIRENEKWWLIPTLIVLFLTGFMIATAGTTSVPVFIYPLA